MIVKKVVLKFKLSISKITKDFLKETAKDLD